MKKYWEAIKKDFWVVLLDIIAVNASYLLAIVIRFFVNGQFRPVVLNQYLPAFWQFTPFYTPICITIFLIFRLYGGMWRYAGINDMNRIIGASVLTSIIHIAGTCLFVKRMPITYYAIGGFLQFLFIVTIRFGYRVLLVEKKKIKTRGLTRINCVVVGSGENGRRIVKNLEETDNFRPVAIVGLGTGMMDGIPIIGLDAVDWENTGAVYIADPFLSIEDRRNIRKKCDKNDIEFQDYTGYISNLGGTVSVTELLSLISGAVIIDINGVERSFSSGEEAIQSFTQKYDVKQIEGKIKIKLIDHQKIKKQDALMAAYAAVLGDEVGEQK